MKKLLTILGLILLSSYSYSDNLPLEIDYSIISKTITNNAIALRERALSDNLSVDIVESLTTEVGPRRMGTDGDQRAISWALEKFKELGFDRFWTEEVLLDRGWVRGEAKAEILSPYPHNIVMTALGYSVGTNGDLVGEIVELREQGVDVVLVSSGSIVEGMQRLGWKERPRELHKLQAAAAVGQMGLVETYQRAFSEYGVQAAQVLLTDADLTNRGR